MGETAKILMIAGLVVFSLGAAISMLGNLFPGLGHLPGDIRVIRPDFSFYFPLTTCLVISAILTLFFWFFSKR